MAVVSKEVEQLERIFLTCNSVQSAVGFVTIC